MSRIVQSTRIIKDNPLVNINNASDLPDSVKIIEKHKHFLSFDKANR